MTVKFAPSRCEVVKEFACQKICVFCKKSILDNSDVAEEGWKSLLNDSPVLDYEDSVTEKIENRSRNDRVGLVRMPRKSCCTRDGFNNPHHYAHQSCLMDQQRSNPKAGCPQCAILKEQLAISEGFGGEQYCSGVRPFATLTNSGFVSSSKIQRIKDWYMNDVPKNDKVSC